GERGADREWSESAERGHVALSPRRADPFNAGAATRWDAARRASAALPAEERQVVAQAAQPLERLGRGALARARRLEPRRLFGHQLGERRGVGDLAHDAAQAEGGAR